LKGTGFLLSDNKDRIENQDNKFKPAVPNDKEPDIQIDKPEIKIGHMPEKNPGLCNTSFSL